MNDLPQGGFTVHRETTYTVTIAEQQAGMIGRALVRFCMTHPDTDEAWEPARALAERLGSHVPRSEGSK